MCEFCGCGTERSMKSPFNLQRKTKTTMAARLFEVVDPNTKAAAGGHGDRRGGSTTVRSAPTGADPHEAPGRRVSAVH